MRRVRVHFATIGVATGANPTQSGRSNAQIENEAQVPRSMETSVRMIATAIQDRRRLSREGLGLLFEAEPDIDVVGAVASPRDILELCETTAPQVLVFQADGLEEMAQPSVARPGAVLDVTEHRHEEPDTDALERRDPQPQEDQGRHLPGAHTEERVTIYGENLDLTRFGSAGGIDLAALSRTLVYQALVDPRK